MRRASAVVRAWDGPNSRIAFEMDLDQMPWGPFEALGKRVTLLVPRREGEAEAHEDGDGGEPVDSHLERALRHVEHAAERCAEFAELGNGSDQLWRTSLETWEWLRDFLTAAWTEGTARGVEGDDGAGESVDGAASAPPDPGSVEPEEAGPSAPNMPGAAGTLEAAANALRQTPLAVWREAIGTFNPDAPTREEAIQTLMGVARLLGRAAEAEPEPSGKRAAAPPEHGEPAGPVGEAESVGPTDPDSGRASDSSGEPSGSSDASLRNDDELSFDYAAGYDEGYRMGRRVGRALAARERSGRER